MGYAYSEANAGETLANWRDKWDAERQVYSDLTFEDMERFARIIAYKTAKNLEGGYRMDPSANPLNIPQEP